MHQKLVYYGSHSFPLMTEISKPVVVG